MDEDQIENPTRQLLNRDGSRRAWLPLASAVTRTRTILLASLIAAAALLPPPPFVAAKVVREATCGVETDGGTKLLGSKAYTESFTAQHNGKLTNGFVETYNVQNSPATYTVELWAADVFGLPTGTGPLASTTVLQPRSGYEFDYSVFSTPAKVSAGLTYAFVVTVPDANNNGVTVVPNNPCLGALALSNAGSIGTFQSDPTFGACDSRPSLPSSATAILTVAKPLSHARGPSQQLANLP